MTLTRLNPGTVHQPLAPYNHSIEAPPGAHWLHVAGQTAVTPAGDIPDGIAAQSEQVFTNLGNVLAASGYGFEDVVMITTYLLRLEDKDPFMDVRVKYFGATYPCSTFLLVSGLANPAFIVEVDAVAAKVKE